MTAFKICSPRQLSNTQYRIINYSHHDVLSMAMIYLVCNWKSSYFLTPFTHTYSTLPIVHLWQPLICSLYNEPVVLFAQIPQVNETVTIFLILISLSIMPSRYIHVVTNGKISCIPFFLMAELYVYMYHMSLSPINRPLGCFHILSVMLQ